MDRGSQPKSRLASVTFAWEMLCLNRAGSMLNITSQRQDPEILIFCYIRVYHEKSGHMLKPFVPKFRSDLSVRLRDIAEKQVPTKLKPIVGYFADRTTKMGFSYKNNVNLQKKSNLRDLILLVMPGAREVKYYNCLP